MIKLNKNEILTVIAVAVIFFTMFINWSFYAWLGVLALMIGVAIWYYID